MSRRAEYIEINGLRFHVHLWGDRGRPLIVFLHGYFDSGIAFEGLTQHLQNDFFCVAPDLRGFGRTEHAATPMGYHFYEHVSDVYQMVLHYGQGETCTLVGHSMGGNLALCFAGTFPEKVDGIVSIEGYGVPDAAPEAMPARLRRWIVNVANGPPAARSYPDFASLLDRQRKRFPRANEALDRLRFRHMALRDEATGRTRLSADPRHRWGAPYLIRAADTFAFWKRIRSRCVVVIADDSETKAWIERFEGRGSVAARLAQLPAHAEVVTLYDCGHLVHLERTDALLDILDRFLSRQV